MVRRSTLHTTSVTSNHSSMAVIVEVKESKKYENKIEKETVNKKSAAPENGEIAAKKNWRKIFAVRKFLSLAINQSKASPAEFLVANRYLVGKKIANGAFGQLRLGKNTETGQQVAIKLESVNARIPMLFLEHRFYKGLDHGCVGVPQIHHFGTCGGKYNALVMDLLGPNLEELFNTMGRKFSLKTVLLIAIQLLSRIEHIHKKYLIYRDIKPENCLIGRKSNNTAGIIHIVDFGLAKQFLDPETGRHINYSENKNLTGTVRYMSVNAHQGKEQSRRDDLEALGYVFIYFLTGGSLPWQGVRSDDGRKRYQIIGKIKEETDIPELCQNYPWEFRVYLQYCKDMRFTQGPDYSYLRSLFRGCLLRHNFEEDYEFDWSRKRSKLDLINTIPASPTVSHDPATFRKLEEDKKIEVKKMKLDVQQHAGDPERMCRSLPTSLRNSPDATTDSLTSIQDKNKSLSSGNDEVNATSPPIAKTSPKSSKVKELEKPVRSLPMARPKVMLIPIVKISPAENEQHLHLPKATNRDLKTENNQLVVPNGRSGGKRRESVDDNAKEYDESNYGSTTLRVNPFDKSCITQVADMKRAKNTVEFVTCSTCFPIFHKMKMMKRRSS